MSTRELEFNVGQLLKDLRSRSGLSQTDLAKRSGFSLPEISRWENNHRCPTAETFLRYAAGCGFEPYFKSRKEDA